MRTTKIIGRTHAFSYVVGSDKTPRPNRVTMTHVVIGYMNYFITNPAKSYIEYMKYFRINLTNDYI